MIEFENIKCNGLKNPNCLDSTPFFSWCFKNSYERDVFQKSFKIELFDREQCLLFSAHKESREMFFKYEGELAPLSKYFWQITAFLSNGQAVLSTKQYFCTGLKGNSFEVFGANWIKGSDSYENVGVSFVRNISIDKKISSASLYLFTTAWQRIFINGKAVKEEEYFAPANSDYGNKCIYEKYDISGILKAGQNSVSVLMGGGYNTNYSGWGWRAHCGKAMIAFMDIDYENGETQRIVSDGLWEIYSSNITFCDIYDGERFDATLTPKRLENATVSKSPFAKAHFAAREILPIKIIEAIEPVKVIKGEDGYLYDFGRNFAGFVQIELTAPQGTKIGMQFSELIYSDGQQRTTTNVNAKAYDEYICTGTVRERYKPSFTYHGFRYVKVSGLTDGITDFEITAMVLSSDIASKSYFVCSDNTVNRIHKNVCRSLRSNLMSIPTDCPVRDERTPCAMDSICQELPSIYNFDVHAFYKNWADNLIIGEFAATDHENPDWDGDKILLPFRLGEYFNDFSIAEKHYERLKACIQLFENKCTDYLWPQEGFGDWCHKNDNVFASFYGSPAVVNSTMLYKIALHMVALCKALNNGEEDYYIGLGKNIKNAFEKHYIKEKGLPENGTQIELAMALYTNILPSRYTEKAFRVLCKKLENETPDLGIFGMNAIARVIPQMGNPDLMLEILRNPHCSGFSYQLANGATSLWEQWEFEGIMHSHSHAMFASVDNAFYRGFAGINPTENGFSSFKIKPSIPKDINFLSCKVETASGIIAMDYGVYSYGSEMSVEIPPNTRAEVYMPKTDAEYDLFDGEVLLNKEDFTKDSQHIKFELSSGKYHFRLVEKQYVFQNNKRKVEKI